uniref:Uncharacterized protein n=1 Tax=Arundo donax TaxID=35708 RepID=A0A0A8YNI2_ARUDO
MQGHQGVGGRGAAAAGTHQPQVQLLRGRPALPLPHRRRAVPHRLGIHHGFILGENSVSWLISWCHNLCSDCIRKHNARCSAGDQDSS